MVGARPDDSTHILCALTAFLAPSSLRIMLGPSEFCFGMSVPTNPTESNMQGYQHSDIRYPTVPQRS
jgi:hypothetical protein